MTAVPQASGVERRVATRRQPALGTVCHLAADAREELGLGLVWNISRSGVSMLLHRHLDPGTVVRADLAAANNGYSLPVTLRVAHVARLRTGDYFLGAQFDRELGAEVMQRFLE
jgi:hypothetical protein